MRRLLWLGIGLAVGALVVRKVAQKARVFTPEGIAGSVRESTGGALESLRSFVDDVRAGMAEREEQIHTAIADGVMFDEEDDEGERDGRHPDHPEGLR
ncbi:hypothetical protein [Rhizomonospora bruguierae]|uniref:hypothetical protein n=1 Tax=Rhizomonospora bruguierae TaxID=1581705 RepID=UPI001BD18DE9|nr:hypothetical protein [Micromonospora sp. NBRC 107566]